MKDTDLAYLAGMIDADGYITASRTLRESGWKFAAQVGITGSRREPHDLAASIFGGKVTQHQPKGDNAHYKVQHHWQRTGANAVPIIEAIQPYLRVKCEQAAGALALQESLLIARALPDDDPMPWMPADYDVVGHWHVMVDEIRSHHARRGRVARAAV